MRWGSEEPGKSHSTKNMSKKSQKKSLRICVLWEIPLKKPPVLYFLSEKNHRHDRYPFLCHTGNTCVTPVKQTKWFSSFLLKAKRLKRGNGGRHGRGPQAREVLFNEERPSSGAMVQALSPEDAGPGVRKPAPPSLPAFHRNGESPRREV